MWKDLKVRRKMCKLPGFLRYARKEPGSVWECPRCGDLWEVRFDFCTGTKSLEPLSPRSLEGCGTWSCDCGPHPNPARPVDPMYLCFEHRRHVPCRYCD